MDDKKCLNCKHFTMKIWFVTALDSEAPAIGYCTPPWMEEPVLAPLSGIGVCDEYEKRDE